MRNNELSKFLVRAKKNTYASGKKPNALEDGSEEFIYQENNLLYKDKYKGSNPFKGRETVFDNEKAIWEMNYYGKAHSNLIDLNAIYEFLKKALNEVDERKPFRGSSIFCKKHLLYRNNSRGNVSKFDGIESIFYNGEEVYSLTYHGGLI